MNIQQKIQLAKEGKRCSICLSKNSVVECRTCKKEDKLAGFCLNHLFRHDNERAHKADFKHLVRKKTIMKKLYGDSYQ